MSPHNPAVEALGVAVAARVPVLLWGAPGTGKTSAIRAMAQTMGLPCETVIASIREPSDFAGLPIVVGDEVRFAPPAWARRLADAGHGLLFLDELSTAPPAVQAALLRVVLERVVGDLTLPDEVAVVAAANPPEQAADGWDLSQLAQPPTPVLTWELTTNQEVRDMRLLGAARLSHKTDESTSIERQREQITLTAKVRGDELVHTTEDTDVSGSISPFLRESLGPWLTDPKKVSQWDGLIVPKLDRLTRSLSDFDELVGWLDKNGKTLISISESLDFSTSAGRMFANILASFAQFERERMSERRTEAAVKIRDNGWWAGFGYPYGNKPVKCGDHWELEYNPETYPVLAEIAGQLIHGYSASSIARKLNATEVPTPANGKKWRQNTIRDIFTSPKCVLDDETLVLVREALDKTKQGWTKRGDAALLLNVAYCICGAPLYSKRYTSKGHTYEYYDCSASCGQRRIPMAELERDLDAHMDYLTGPVFKKVVIKGRSIKTELSRLERKIRSLDLDDEDQRQTLMSERKSLIAANGDETDRIDYEETSLTVGDYWPTLDKIGKRQFLMESGIKFIKCRRTPDGKVRGQVSDPSGEFVMVS
jgi:DNA invertase Pin-like site-specific DNA recombinase